MKQDKVLSLLGLARRAGRIRSGGEQTVEAIRKGNCRAVVIAKDASERSIKQIRDKCNYRNIPYVMYADRDTLGACIGQTGRSCIAVCDDGLAAAILEQIKDQTE